MDHKVQNLLLALVHCHFIVSINEDRTVVELLLDALCSDLALDCTQMRLVLIHICCQDHANYTLTSVLLLLLCEVFKEVEFGLQQDFD